MNAWSRNDDDIIARVQQGDKEAFSVLVRQYMKPAYFSALAIVGSHDDALDLSQQAFIRAWKAIGSFELGRAFYTWYYRILRNLCLNFVRDRSVRAQPFSRYPEVLEHKSSEDNPLEATERAMLRERVRLAMGKLRSEEREIILLREFDGYSYDEIASLLECPVGTVMSRLYYARKHLKTLLEDEHD